MQRKFFDYGGERRLDELPHVLATVSEPEQVRELAVTLKTEAEVLAQQPPRAAYELFVLIDNYDEFADEIEKDRDLGRDLAALARRYGRDGLHFLISGTLDGGKNDFQRRVLAANFGLALQTAQAVDTFRVARVPAALRRGELVPGRGYVIKSGQLALVQIALPYATNGLAATNGASTNGSSAADPLSSALDQRVAQICARYPDQRVSWAVATPDAAAPAASAAQPSARTQQIIKLLQAGMRKELAGLPAGAGDGNGSDGLLVAALVQQLNTDGWHDEAVLMPMLKQLWVKEHTATGLGVDVFDTDLDTVLLLLESLLPE